MFYLFLNHGSTLFSLYKSFHGLFPNFTFNPSFSSLRAFMWALISKQLNTITMFIDSDLAEHLVSVDDVARRPAWMPPPPSRPVSSEGGKDMAENVCWYLPSSGDRRNVTTE